MERKRTLAELAREANAVQNACNLSGVLYGFAKVASELRELTGNTTAGANHPIAQAYADKVSSLCGIQLATPSDLAKVYREVDRLASSDE